MANESLKDEIRVSGLKFWQVAEAYGCVDTTFSKRLRKELPEAEKARIRSIIVELSRKEA